MAYTGRKKIKTDQLVITEGNVIEVLNKALTVHSENRSEIEYLWNYVNGKQDILERVKDVRPEICNRVVENHAREIVDFKVGYLMGEPVQYVCTEDGADIADKVAKLNRYMVSEEKAAKDQDLAEWSHICGTAYRMVLPDRSATRDSDEAPFEIYTLDPRNTFVVYAKDLGEYPVMGVKYIVKDDGDIVYTVYTDEKYYDIQRSADDAADIRIIESGTNARLGIPIVEYPLNNARMGSFEIVKSLLDAINSVQSNRLDGIEQFIQAILVFHNVDIDEKNFEQMKELGGVKIKDGDPQMPGEIKYLVEQLNQGETQTVVDDLYEKVLVICGMPNRNGGSSTSDTGSAVIMRDGWSAAETRAKATENMFKRSERIFLKKVLDICKDLKDLQLKMGSIEVRFTRRNYENITQKSTVLTQMLGCEKIAPQLAYTHCGMFADPETAWKMSEAYIKEQERKAEKIAKDQIGPDTGGGAGNQQNPAAGKPRGNRDDAGQNRGVGSVKPNKV